MCVKGETVGKIPTGLLVLLGVEKDDAEVNAERIVERILGYRVFADDEGKMNLSARDINAGILLVPQFTLAADTRKGTRAGFSTAAEPAKARQLFDSVGDIMRGQHARVETGVFGADMDVELINQGPVTFWLTS